MRFGCQVVATCDIICADTCSDGSFGKHLDVVSGSVKHGIIAGHPIMIQPLPCRRSEEDTQQPYKKDMTNSSKLPRL